VLKTVLLLLSTLVLTFPRAVLHRVNSIRPIVSLLTDSDRESKKDTVATDEEKESKEAVSISITDEGIRLNTGGKERYILDLEGIEIPEEMLEKLGGIPESILAKLDYMDDERYYRDRGRDIVKLGEDLHVAENELIRGDVVSVAGDVIIEGKVMGDVVSVFGDIELESTAIVNGEAVCVFGELYKEDGARVRGETVVVGGNVPSASWIFPAFGKGMFRFVSRIVMFIIGVLLMGIVLAMLPDRMKRSSEYVFGSFFKSLGLGALILFGGSFFVAIFAIILGITIVGIPIAILLGLSFAALMLIGYFVSAFALGKLIARRFNMGSDSAFLHGFLGLLLLSVLGLISGIMFFSPFLQPLRILFKTFGGFLQLLALLTGVGAFILSKAGTISREARPTLPE